MRRTATGCAPLLAAALAGCSRSPSQDIMGSFFPSWLLCLLIGVVAAVVCRVVLARIGVAEHVLAPMLAYPAAGLAVTFLVWLVWFGN